MRVRINNIGVNLNKVTHWYCGNYSSVKYVAIFFGKQELKFQVDDHDDDDAKAEYQWLMKKLEEMFPVPDEIDKQEAETKEAMGWLKKHYDNFGRPRTFSEGPGDVHDKGDC